MFGNKSIFYFRASEIYAIYALLLMVFIVNGLLPVLNVTGSGKKALNDKATSALNMLLEPFLNQ